jgi:hypothetical protein
MSPTFWRSLTLLMIAIALGYGLVWFRKAREGFIGDPNAQYCGVDAPPCPFGTACINGYCVGTNPPKLPKDTGLPVLPTPQQMNTVMVNFRQ